MCPSSPQPLCRDCSDRATANGYCAAHQTVNYSSFHRQLYDRFRVDDPIRKLYKTPRWRATRAKVLRRDILCVSCGHAEGAVIDHILSARLVVDNFGVDAFYDPDRCQALCKSCHDSKTALECGWTGKRGTRLESLGDRTNTTVVCGIAGSGKTTYVEANKRPEDLVWDYDVVMADVTGLPLHHGLPGAVGSVLAKRDQFLESTQHSSNRVWLIVANPKAVIVTMLVAAGAALVVMDIAEEICRERLRARFNIENAQAPCAGSAIAI